MSVPLSGIHHVTAIAGEPSQNAEFYSRVLGLRLVKYTVNHDDPETLHLYYGDRRGWPGTTITFFDWAPDRKEHRFGAGQTRHTAYLIRPRSFDYWQGRLSERSIAFKLKPRFGDSVIQFRDPDGIGLELVAAPRAESADVTPWEDSPVDAEHQLCGFDSVTIAVAEIEPTEHFFSDVLGYRRVNNFGGRTRLQSGDGGPGSLIDLVETDEPRGKIGIGSVHHVALKVQDSDEQQRLRSELLDFGLEPTEPIDRHYFQSIYCREPGGVLLEFATLSPGFTRDEPLDELGSSFVLPPSLQSRREEIEEATPKLELSRFTH